MTTDQPQPGSELDERLAKAMGWKPIYGYRFGTWVSPKADEHRNEPLPYSTDTATAIATLEQLCKPVEEGGRGWDGFNISFSRERDGSNLYCVIIDPSSHTNTVTAVESTIAHAAALAMLAALEAEG